MKIETSVMRKIGWLIVGLLVLFLAWCSSGATKSSQPKSPVPGLILRNSSGPDAWIGGMHGPMPGNRLGHPQRSFRMVPAEASPSRDGLLDKPLPGAALPEAMSAPPPVAVNLILSSISIPCGNWCNGSKALAIPADHFLR